MKRATRLFFSGLFLVIFNLQINPGQNTIAIGIGQPANAASCSPCMTQAPVFSAKTVAMDGTVNLTVSFSPDTTAIAVVLYTADKRDVADISAAFNLEGSTIKTLTISPDNGTSSSINARPAVDDYFPMILLSNASGTTTYDLNPNYSTTAYTARQTDTAGNTVSQELTNFTIPWVTVGVLEGVPRLTGQVATSTTSPTPGRPMTFTLPVTSDTAIANVSIINANDNSLLTTGSANYSGGNEIVVNVTVPHDYLSSMKYFYDITDATGQKTSRYTHDYNVLYDAMLIEQSVDGGQSWVGPHRTNLDAVTMFPTNPQIPIMTISPTFSSPVVIAGELVTVQVAKTTNGEYITVELVDDAGNQAGIGNYSNLNNYGFYDNVPVDINSLAEGRYYPKVRVGDYSKTYYSRYTASGSQYAESQSEDSGVSWTPSVLQEIDVPYFEVLQPLAGAPKLTDSPVYNYADIEPGVTISVTLAADANTNEVTVEIYDGAGNIVGNTTTAYSGDSMAIPVTISDATSPGSYYPKITLAAVSDFISVYNLDTKFNSERYTLSQSPDAGASWPVAGATGTPIPWVNVSQPVVGAPVMTANPSYDKDWVVPGETVNVTIPISTSTKTVEVKITKTDIYTRYVLGSETATNTTGAGSVTIPIAITSNVSNLSVGQYFAYVTLTDETGDFASIYDQNTFSAIDAYTVKQTDNAWWNSTQYVSKLPLNTITIDYYSEGTLANPKYIGTAPLNYEGLVKGGGTNYHYPGDDGYDSFYHLNVEPNRAYKFALTNTTSDARLYIFKAPPVNDPYAGIQCNILCDVFTDNGETELYIVVDTSYVNAGTSFNIGVTPYPSYSTTTSINFEDNIIPDEFILTGDRVYSDQPWSIVNTQNTTPGGTSSLKAGDPVPGEQTCFSFSVIGMNTVSFSYFADTVRNTGDFLTFYINGQQASRKSQWSAMRRWNTASFDLSGQNNLLKWCLNKEVGWLDPAYAWIDDIVIE